MVKKNGYKQFVFPLGDGKEIKLFYAPVGQPYGQTEQVFDISRFRLQFANHCRLIDLILPEVFKQKGAVLNILDLCSGVGSYPVYIGKRFPELVNKIYATELNQQAMQMFRMNVTVNELDDKVVLAPVREQESRNPFSSELPEDLKFDLIISNPPYVPVPANYKYHRWATGGFLGLEVVVEILNRYTDCLTEHGKMIWISYFLGGLDFEKRNILTADLYSPEVEERNIESQLTILRRFVASSVNFMYVSLPPAWNGFDHRFKSESIEYERYFDFIEDDRESSPDLKKYLSFLREKGINYLHNYLVETSSGMGPDNGTYIINTLKRKKINEIMDLERICWPEDLQASAANIKSRLKYFSKGCFGVYSIEGRLLGFSTSQIIELPAKYTRASANSRLPIMQTTDWMSLDTQADATIDQTQNIEGNCLHFVSGCVHPQFRSLGIWQAMIKARIMLAQNLNLRFCAVLSRLSDFGTNGDLDIQKYISSGADRYLNTFNKFRFESRAIVDVNKSRLEDKYWILLVKDLENYDQ